MKNSRRATGRRFFNRRFSFSGIAERLRRRPLGARKIPRLRFDRPLDPLRISLLCAVALGTLYLIATHSVPAGLAETEPDFALSLNPSYPAAVVAHAQRAVMDEVNRRAAEKDKGAGLHGNNPAGLGAVKKSLRAALLKEPLNASAFRLLGQIALLENDPKSARRYMAEAAGLSIEESAAIEFMLRESLLANNVADTLRYADILMRSNTRALGPAAQLVARLTEVPAAKRALVAMLGAAPPWRPQVLDAFGASSPANPQAPLDVLLALKDTPNPPSEKEVARYIDFLLQKKLYAFAYSSWLQFLPKDRFDQVAYLFNGSFEQQPSGAPFDWTIGSNSEIVAGVYALPEDNKKSGLFISFGQVRGAFPTIRQTTVLRPGAYRFTGSMTGEILARRGLQWRMTCSDGATVGASEMLIGRVPKWTPFEFDVTIPDEKCPAQNVELVHMARSPSEQLATGSVWFDDLAIVRRNVAAPTATP